VIHFFTTVSCTQARDGATPFNAFAANHCVGLLSVMETDKRRSEIPVSRMGATRGVVVSASDTNASGICGWRVRFRVPGLNFSSGMCFLVIHGVLPVFLLRILRFSSTPDAAHKIFKLKTVFLSVVVSVVVSVFFICDT
jgi:hypothetical protein